MDTRFCPDNSPVPNRVTAETTHQSNHNHHAATPHRNDMATCSQCHEHLSAVVFPARTRLVRLFTSYSTLLNSRHEGKSNNDASNGSKRKADHDDEYTTDRTSVQCCALHM